MVADVRVRQVLRGGASLNRLSELMRLPRPVGARALISAYNEVIVLEEALVTSDGVALGGHHKITLRNDGWYRYEGYFRATAWPSFQVSLATHVIGSDGTSVVVVAQGKVHGRNEPGDNEYHWAQEGFDPLVRERWPRLVGARIEHDLEYDMDFFGTPGQVLAFVAKSAAGLILGGAVGVVIVLGMEAIDEFELHELALPGTVGLLFMDGIVLVFGPAALIPALIIGIAAGAILAAMVHQRPLTDEEYNFVNRVFKDTLDRDRILLTNLVGESDRAFTIPGPGNTILVNIGAGEADPIRYTGYGGSAQGIRAPGQLLVHELVHAWQIRYSHFIPGLMCTGIKNQVGTLGGSMDVYSYGPATSNFDEFNLEQQASIVDQWFAGSMYFKQQGAFDPMLEDESNPYWRYIRDNLRAGVG